MGCLFCAVGWDLPMLRILRSPCSLVCCSSTSSLCLRASSSLAKSSSRFLISLGSRKWVINLLNQKNMTAEDGETKKWEKGKEGKKSILILQTRSSNQATCIGSKPVDGKKWLSLGKRICIEVTSGFNINQFIVLSKTCNHITGKIQNNSIASDWYNLGKNWVPFFTHESHLILGHSGWAIGWLSHVHDPPKRVFV